LVRAVIAFVRFEGMLTSMRRMFVGNRHPRVRDVLELNGQESIKPVPHLLRESVLQESVILMLLPLFKSDTETLGATHPAAPSLRNDMGWPARGGWSQATDTS
jgi:hypothetical protein